MKEQNYFSKDMQKFNIVEIQNFESNTTEIKPKEETWKKYSKIWGNKLHQICSYTAMFPPRLANYFIKNYSQEGDIVLDTFSGRGTTILEARLLNRKAFGFDLNPFAYVLSRAKAKNINKNLLFERLKEWEKKYLEENNEFSRYFTDELLTYYSVRNLNELIFIQQNYGKNWENLDDLDNFILAVTLGIMHGPMKKDKTSSYLSLGMSNTVSMSVNYVKKYTIEKALVKPKEGVFNKIKERIEKIYSHSSVSKLKNNLDAEVKVINALNISEKWNDKPPKLIFTSPPYLNIINYTKQNWLKMWLLGYENNEDRKNIRLDDNHNFLNYSKFMEEYLLNVCKIMDKKSKLILVIGDVIKQEKKTYSFEGIWDSLKNIVPLRLIKLYTDEYNQKSKSTNAMGTRSGRATRVDKMYIFKLK